MSECLKIWVGGEKNGSFVGGIICPPVALGLTTLPKYKGACIPPAPRFRHLCAFWLLAELNWTIESDSYNPFYFTRKILVCSVYGTHWMTSDIKDFPCNLPWQFRQCLLILKLMIKACDMPQAMIYPNLGTLFKMNNLNRHIVIYTATVAESCHGRWKSLMMLLS